MKKLLTVATSVLLIIAIGTAAAALFGGHRRGPSPHRRWGDDPARFKALATEHLDHALEHLEATDEQRARIRAIMEQLIVDGDALVADHNRLRAEVVAHFSADKPDAALLHALVDEEADALRAFGHTLVDDTVELHGVLTPEQRDVIAQKMQQRARNRTWRWM